MFLVDSHCHLDQLDLAKYQGDLTQALDFARSQDVKHFLCVCITLREFPTILAIAKQYPQVHVSVGLHPNEVDIDEEPTVQALAYLAESEKVIAIGETGLDYYRSKGEIEWQRNRFRNHIRAAIQCKKPLIIHTRQAKEDTLRIMQEENAKWVSGVMHCFTEAWAMAEAALDMGFYISFSGIVTFPNAKEIQEVAKRVPLDRLLIETDSPYLAPVPYRGKSNEPGYVRQVAEFIANLRGMSVEEIAEHSTANFFRLFKMTRPEE